MYVVERCGGRVNIVVIILILSGGEGVGPGITKVRIWEPTFLKSYKNIFFRLKKNNLPIISVNRFCGGWCGVYEG